MTYFKIFLLFLSLVAQPLLGSEQSGLFTVDMNKLFRSSDFGKKIISANNKARLELQNENEVLESELLSEEKELSEQRKILSLEDFRPKALEFDKKVSIIRTEQNEKEENLKIRPANKSRNFIKEFIHCFTKYY